MKKRSFNTLMILGLGIAFAVTSCETEEPILVFTPAPAVVGTYTGSFTGTYGTIDTVNADTYTVVVTKVTDQTIKVDANDMDAFNVKLNGPDNAIVVVDQETSLTNFVFIDSSERLNFTYEKGDNSAVFAGKK